MSDALGQTLIKLLILTFVTLQMASIGIVRVNVIPWDISYHLNPCTLCTREGLPCYI